MRTMRKLLLILLMGFVQHAFSQPDTLNYEPGKLWIGLKEPLSEESLDKFKKALKINEKDKEIKELKQISKVFNSEDKTLGKIYELTFTKGKDIEKYLKKYGESFEYVEYKPSNKLVDTDPNDYLPSGDTALWHIDHIGIRSAWNRMNEINRQTKLAIIESGFEGNHEDLSGNIGYIEPSANYSYWHGTRVAGIAGMTTNNGVGYCSLSGRFSSLYLYHRRYIMDNIRKAADDGCKVINMSFPYSFSPSSTLDAAINYAHSKGVFLVASAGNIHDPGDESKYQYPACSDHVIAVAALKRDNIRRSNSKYYDLVDISAPGDHITTTDINNKYHQSNSTSSAAPVISGVASLVFAVNPNFSPDDVEKILKTSADKSILSLSNNQLYRDGLGVGIVDADGAVTCAINLMEPQVIKNAFCKGVYNSYSIKLQNCFPNGNVYLHTKNLVIEGTFYMGVGKEFVVIPDYNINCN